MPPSASNRPRRFTLPALADARSEEAIHDFLSGPARARGRADGAQIRHENPLATLTTRVTWMEALERESARSRRYRRPAAVLVVAAESKRGATTATGWLTRVAGPIAHAVHRGLRETDLVTRASEATFQVLLPETTAREAARVASRVAADCDVWLQAIDAPIVVRTASAGTSAETTLEGALDRALAQIKAAA